MYKDVNGMSPEIMNGVFKQRSNSHYNPRHTSQFYVNPIHHSVYNGIKSASYMGPKICEQKPEIWSKYLKGFKWEIKKWKPTDCIE